MASVTRSTSSTRFEGLLSRYFERLLQDEPRFAVISGGLSSGEGRLGQMSLEHQEKRERERQRCLRALEDISPRELSNEQHLDRLALQNHLLKESEDFARGRHVLEPAAPAQLLDILLHELMRAEQAPRRAARNLRSLLRQAPGFLEEAGAVARKPERIWLRLMEQSVGGSPSLLEGVLQLLSQVDPEPDDKTSAGSVQKALTLYCARVQKRPLAPEGSFAIGVTTLQRRVRDEIGLDYTLGQIERLALGEIDRVGTELAEACKPFGRGLTANEVINQARSEWRPATPLVNLYRSETKRVAQAFRAARAVSFPVGDDLQVRDVPEFLRNVIPTAAYTQPGAFERHQRGVFWVNDLSKTRESKAEQLAEQQQHFGLPLTCAHEAYPGHHLQFVTANRHPRKWRRLFAHAVFYEGWTLWCEQMFVDLRIARAPWLRVQQLHDALWRCHRILVDLRLQTGRYTHRQAARHLQQHLGFTRARSEAEANWYTAQPAVPMSYWLGRLENERLRRRLMDGRGWSLRKFNDWLLSFGTIPQGWIEKYGLA